MNIEKFDAELRAAYECGFRAGYLNAETVVPPFQYRMGDLCEVYFGGVEAGKKERQARIKVWGRLWPREPDGKGDLT
jgi:hypothetical protein